MKYKVQPWDHQLRAIEAASREPGYAFFMEMGCLARDAIISVNVNGNGLKLSIEDLYRRANRTELAYNERGFTGSIKVRSLKEDYIGLNRALAIYRSGEKEVFRLKVKGQRPLKLTSEHRIMTKRGWVEAGSLRPGDRVACDVLTRHKKKVQRKKLVKPRYNLLTVGPHHPYSHVTTVHGNKRHRVEKHRLIYEAFENGLPLGAFIEKTHDWNNLAFNDPSEWHIHHIDHNPRNNDIKNLAKLTPGEHFAHHGDYKHFGHGRISWRSFESFEYVGREMTYDIAAEEPYNSFIANGIVVHNTGKSGAAVNVLRARCYQHRRLLRTLIFCPPVVKENWKREIAMHSTIDPSNVHVLTGPSKKRAQVYQEKDGIFITNYESLTTDATWQAIRKKPPELLIFDESHKVKDRRAKRTKKAIRLADLAEYKLILTGTPILNDPQDIWSQFRILDGGKTFDRNFVAFQARWFIDRNAGMPKDRHFPDWQPIPGLEEAFNAKIYKKALRVLKKDCLDLPPFVRKRVFVEMEGDQARMYKSMKTAFIAYLNEKTCVAKIALTKLLRLQQIASGFFKDDEGEVTHYAKNPRLKALEEILEGIGCEHKVIIWSIFRDSYDQITGLLDRLGLNHVCLYGGMTDKERDRSVKAFNEDPSVRVIVSNQAAGGTGINLTAASYAVYFSRSHNLEHDLQSEARCYRGGSEVHDKITRIDIVCPGSVDELVLDALARKQDMADKILKLQECEL